MIVIRPITTLFKVFFIVFLVVGNKIVQGESIMRRDEINTRIGLASTDTIKIATTRKPIGQIPK